MLRETGAQGIAVTTRNEELAEQTFHAGDFGGVFPGPLLTGPRGTRREGDGTLVSQTLDTVAEQLDTVLLLVHTASEKQELILRLNQLLSNPVFEAGMDQVVLTLAQRVRVPGFLLVYRDAVRPAVLHYRAYRHGHLEHDSGSARRSSGAAGESGRRRWCGRPATSSARRRR